MCANRIAGMGAWVELLCLGECGLVHGWQFTVVYRYQFLFVVQWYGNTDQFVWYCGNGTPEYTNVVCKQYYHANLRNNKCNIV